MTGQAAVDVAVVGSGTAGCAAALRLHGRGCTVAMLSPANFRRNGTGEALSPAAGPLLEALGIGRRFAAGPHRQANASYAAWETPLLAQHHSIAQAGPPGHVLDRGAFERMMFDAASRTSATVIPAALMGAHRRAGGWTLDLAGGRTLRARHVLDCSGRAAVFARRCSPRRRADKLVAACCVVEQSEHDVEPSAATLIEAAADGWWYAALRPDRRLSLMFFTDPDLLAPGVSRDVAVWRSLIDRTLFVRRWLTSAAFTVGGPPRLQSAATTWLDTAAGLGWTAAGDAAVAFDPLSSHGLTTALWGGGQAAEAALDSLGGQDDRTTTYVQVVANAIQDFLVQRKAIYSRAPRYGTSLFWQRRASDRGLGARADSASGKSPLAFTPSARSAMDMTASYETVIRN